MSAVTFLLSYIWFFRYLYDICNKIHINNFFMARNKRKNPILEYFNTRGNKFPYGGVVQGAGPVYTGVQSPGLNYSLAPMNTASPGPVTFQLSGFGSGANAISGAVGGLAGLASGIASNVQNTGDLSSTYSGISDQFSGSESTGYDALADEWSLLEPQEHVSWRDVRGKSGGIGGIAGTTAEGAAVGSIVPGIGTAIGAAAGALIGGISNIFGKRKAKRKARRINKQIDRANQFAVNDLINRADMIDIEQDLDVMGNYSAYGGPLNLYRSGGGIKIDPSKRGTFRAQASRMGMGVQEAARKILSAPKGRYSAAMRKKASFARNFAHKHGYGGYLFYPDEFTEFNTGGTHEESPLGGIPQGMDNEGTPNLVEEGESRYKDYIFSNRLYLDKDMLKSAGLPLSLDGKTFSQAAKFIAREPSENPFDPISRRSLKDGMTKLMVLQEGLKSSDTGNTFATGGFMDYPPAASWKSINIGPPDSLTVLRRNDVPVSSGSWKSIDISSPSEFPVTGSDIPFRSWKSIDISPVVTPSPVTSGSVTAGNVPVSKTVRKKSPVRREDPGLMTVMGRESGINNGDFEYNLMPMNTETDAYISPSGRQGGLPDRDWTLGIDSSILRYAPALGSAIGAFMNNGPDYSNADRIERAVRNVNFDPVGNYLAYTPLDRNYYLNKLGSQAGATRRAIVNQSAGNRSTALAGLLAADYNYGNAMGQLARQAEEYNLGQRERVEAFNRGTNQFNSEGKLKADSFNAELGLKAAMAAAQMREAERNNTDAARSANLTRFFDNLGEIGRESFSRNMVNFNPANYYTIDSSGKIRYKGMDDLDEDQKESVRKQARARARKKSHGGFLNI